MKLNRAGVFCLFSPKNSDNGKDFARYGKDIPKLLKIARDPKNSRRNWYMSFNSMATWHRSENNVLGLNGLFIDVDCNRNGVDKGEFLYHLIVLNDVLNIVGLPDPNVIVDSGHGFYLKWYFKDQVIVHNQSINRLWNKLERSIVKRFNVAASRIFGVKLGDPKATDSSRVLRVTNTWNVKRRPVKCQLIKYCPDDRHDMFKYWVENYLPKIHYRNHHKRIPKRPKINVKWAKNGFTLNGMRVNDLNMWFRLRRYNITGKREEFLFIYTCNALHCEPIKSVVSDINHLNDQMTTPLPQSEVMNLVIEMTHLNLKNYKFKSQTIINKLGIKVSEQRHMKTLIGSQVNNHRYQKRHLERKNIRRINRIKRNDKKLHRDIHIMRMHQNGSSVRIIAKNAKCSIGTVSSTIRRCSKTRSLYRVIVNDLSNPKPRNTYKYPKLEEKDQIMDIDVKSDIKYPRIRGD